MRSVLDCDIFVEDSVVVPFRVSRSAPSPATSLHFLHLPLRGAEQSARAPTATGEANVPTGAKKRPALGERGRLDRSVWCPAKHIFPFLLEIAR